jgi:hypothetical protein
MAPFDHVNGSALLHLVLPARPPGSGLQCCGLTVEGFMYRFLLACLILPLLAACNPYHPLRGGIGFTEVPLGNETYQVTYVGNRSLAECRQYCLTRAAELAVLRGNPYFQILDERVYMSYGTAYYPGYGGGYYGGGRHGGYWVHSYSPGYAEVYPLPEVTMQIRLCQPNEPNAIPAAYILREALARKVELSPEVAERVAALPPVPAPVAIPPAPPPATQPGYYPPAYVPPSPGYPPPPP